MGTVLATYDELKALKQADISALITDTKNQTRSSVKKSRQRRLMKCKKSMPQD